MTMVAMYDREGRWSGLKATSDGTDDGVDPCDRFVCVTSGLSYLGLAIVNVLLSRGYYVRLIVTNQEDLDKAREMQIRGSHKYSSTITSAVLADFDDVASLSEAFQGCHGVFHTATLIDPSGLSGYSKWMGEIEVRACKNVMKACSRTCSVTKCVLTSSLLACIWGDHSTTQLSSSISHINWSDESICLDKKLWYALGKLRAEKVAWKVAEKRGFKLVTICPGLVTGPQFCTRNPTPSIAYLKGAQEMYAKGLLATVDVNKLSEAHVRVYEAMNKTAFGRYICFNHVVNSNEDIEKLTGEMGMQPCTILRDHSENYSCKFQLSNIRLSRLMSLKQCRNDMYW